MSRAGVLNIHPRRRTVIWERRMFDELERDGSGMGKSDKSAWICGARSNDSLPWPALNKVIAAKCSVVQCCQRDINTMQLYSNE